jgi:Cof subfamily protein (haloacid dehalogenase superfamily)
MYKMLTIDVDDTLLTDEMKVTEATLQALQEAIAHGVVVTLATGRMFASAKPIAEQLQLNVPLITYQGSLIKTLMDGQILYERFVPQDAAEWLFDLAQKRNYHIQAYWDDRLYTLRDNEKVKLYTQISKVPYYVEPDADNLLKKPLTKILFYEEPDLLDALAEEIREHLRDQVHITKSKPFFLEILHKEGTKGHAVKFLAEYYGCELSQVIAIGDSWNDREMIQVAGLGVAMGNAVDALKEIADYVTKTNNEDGVKHVIERFILAKQTL